MPTSETKHYVLSLSPTARSAHERQSLTDPLNYKTPDLASLVAEVLSPVIEGQPGGKHLVKVSIQVEILSSEAKHETLPTPDLNWMATNSLISPSSEPKTTEIAY